jgi:hypothetical protein
MLMLSFLLVLVAVPRAEASTMNIEDPWRFATQGGLTSFFAPSGQTCQNDGTQRCALLPASGGTVYTSDYAAAYHWQIIDATDGEVVGVSATEPNGSVVSGPVLTYHSTSNDPPFAEWTDQNGNIVAYEPSGFGEFIAGILQVTCGPIGSWSISLSDNSTKLSTTPFTLGHGSPFINVSSPTDNQLFQLTNGNYNQTDSVQFLASGRGPSPSWSVQLHYLSSGGYGGPDPTPLTYTGYNFSGVYTSVGGQVLATAQTTASDGSAIKDCVTFYVEGPETGIPDATITGQLDSLYTASQSYPTDPTGKYPPTPNLMTGVAMRESTYHQFLYPDELVANQNPDLFNLYKNYQIDAFWPTENLSAQYAGPGQYIGLMQEPTTDPDAWDWTSNTNDAVNLFSGTASQNKIGLATNYAADIVNGDPRNNIDGYYKLNAPVGHQLENMALVLYGGYLDSACGTSPSESCSLNSQYYIPSCSGKQGTTKQKGQTYLTCSTGWQWSVNNANQGDGVAYVAYIMNHLQ